MLNGNLIDGLNALLNPHGWQVVKMVEGVPNTHTEQLPEQPEHNTNAGQGGDAAERVGAAEMPVSPDVLRKRSKLAALMARR